MNKNKKHDSSVLKSNNIVTIQFLLVYFALIIVLSLFSISTSSAAPTKKPTEESSITWVDDSKEVVANPTNLPTLKPIITPTVSPKLVPITTPKPTLTTTPSLMPTFTPEPTTSIIEAIILPSPTIMPTPLATATKSSMSQILLALLTILSFAGIVISMILLIANRIKRRRIKPYIIALLASLAIFIISALFFVSIG